MIRSVRDGGVLVVRIDRPEKRNALTPDMLANLEEAARATHGGEDRPGALLLVGEGRVFCAGFDLDLCRDDRLAMGALLERLSAAIVELRRAACPVVCCAHGAAVAGGCALLGGADIVVTDAGAKLGYPVLALGVSPAVSAPFLRHGVGDGAARERLLDTGLIDGREATRIGLAHECAEDAEGAMARAREIAEALAAKPRHSVAVTKRWLNELDGTTDAQAARASLDVSLSLAGGDEERAMLERMWSR